jgi:hypothetical protein
MIKHKILGSPSKLYGDGIGSTFVKQVLGRSYDVEVAETNSVVSKASMGITLARAGDGDLPSGRLKVNMGDHLVIPVRIIHAKVIWVKLD